MAIHERNLGPFERCGKGTPFDAERSRPAAPVPHSNRGEIMYRSTLLNIIALALLSTGAAAQAHGTHSPCRGDAARRASASAAPAGRATFPAATLIDAPGEADV